MTDVIDFRVSETLAVGHDKLQVIIFRKHGDKRRKGKPWFENASWDPIRFIHRAKRVLLRDLRELGSGEAAETTATLRSLPDDLGEYRAALYGASRASKQRGAPLPERPARQPGDVPYGYEVRQKLDWHQGGWKPCPGLPKCPQCVSNEARRKRPAIVMEIGTAKARGYSEAYAMAA